MNNIYTYGNPEPNILDHVRNATIMAIDIESTGTNVSKDVPLILGVSLDGKSGIAVPWGHESFPWGVLSNDKVILIAHNANFDRSMLKTQGIWTHNYADTMIAAHMLGYQPLNLRTLVGARLGKQIKTFDEIGGLRAGEQKLAEMCASHATMTAALWRVLYDNDNKDSLGMKQLGMKHLFWDIEMPLIPIISDMELTGTLIDQEELKTMANEFSDKLDSLEKAMNSLAKTDDVNYSSPDQVAWLLFTKLRLPPAHSTPKGKRPSTDADTLDGLKDKHPVVPLLLKHREYEKLMGTYIEGIQKRLVDGRIHTNFNQTGTRTGRLSSSDPNLQNIPKRKPEGRRVRKAFIAPEGYSLIVPDKDQLELRELAIQSQDVRMVDAFRSGRDIHTETAILAYGDPARRFDGKTLNYTIAFGGGEAEHRAKFFGAYPGAAAWIKKVTAQGHEDGYARTRHGRIRLLPEINSTNWKFSSHGERELLSTMVQGSAAEEVKRDMYRVWLKLHDMDSRILMQVHDELVIECPDDIVMDIARVVRDNMTCLDYNVPLTVEVKIGKNWRDTEKVKFT